MYVGKKDINKALRHLRSVVNDDQKRDEDKTNARTWIEVYTNKLKEYDN